MNPSTASHRLVKDILYSLIVKTEQNNCFLCGFPMSRDTFSIEHKIPWMGSEDPSKLYFDLENISFSHIKCNIGAARKPHKVYDSKNEANAASGRRVYARLSKEERQDRRQKYNKYGC